MSPVSVDIWPLVSMLLLAGLVLGIVVAAGRIIFSPGTGAGKGNGLGKKVSEPSCGACGYPVAGLDVLRCPECGADLRAVGIVTPQSGASPLRRAFAGGMFWSLVMFGVMMGVSRLVRNAFPPQRHVSAVSQLAPTSDAAGFQNAQITWTGVLAPGQVGYDRALIQIQDVNGPSPGLEVDLRSSPYRSRRAGAGNWTSFDPAGMQAWADAELAVVPPPAREKYVAALWTIVKDYRQTGLTRWTFGPTFRGDTLPAVWGLVRSNAQWYGAAGCIALWFVGLVWIVRRALRGPVELKTAT